MVNDGPFLQWEAPEAVNRELLAFLGEGTIWASAKSGLTSFGTLTGLHSGRDGGNGVTLTTIGDHLTWTV